MMNEKMFIALYEYFEGRQNDEILDEIMSIKYRLDDLEKMIEYATITIDGPSNKEQQKDYSFENDFEF